MKRIICLILSAAIFLSFAACSGGSGTSSAAGNGQSSTAAGKTVTITDDNGTQVTVPTNAKRVAVCGIYPLPSVLCVFFDSAKNIVGMPKESMTAAKNSLLSQLYPEILKASTGFSNGDTVNMEELSKLKPDVVFYSASSKGLGSQLKDAGFCAVAVSVNKWGYSSIETLNHWIALLSQIFPDNNKAKIVRDYSNKVYGIVQSRVKSLPASQRAHVFFLFQYNPNAILTSGKHFFGQWWADAIGAKNVAEELTKDNSVPVNMEQIYKWNPDVVFITNFTTAGPKDLYGNRVGSFNWSSVKAVQNKRVYKMPLGMYRSYTPGVDTPITLLWLAKNTYPKLFSDIDITKGTKDYYKNVFGVNLSSEQAQSIFTPPAAAGSGF